MHFRNTGRMFTWFLVGVGVGAAFGLLYAPLKGRETRRLLTRTAEDAKDYITETSCDLYEKGRELVEDAGELFEKSMKLA